MKNGYKQKKTKQKLLAKFTGWNQGILSDNKYLNPYYFYFLLLLFIINIILIYLSILLVIMKYCCDLSPGSSVATNKEEQGGEIGQMNRCKDAQAQMTS